MTKMTQKEFEKKFGVVCKICKIRKGTFFATKAAEGGRPSVCRCDSKKEK